MDIYIAVYSGIIMSGDACFCLFWNALQLIVNVLFILNDANLRSISSICLFCNDPHQ